MEIVFEKARFFASLRMTIKVNRFMTHHNRLGSLSPQLTKESVVSHPSWPGESTTRLRTDRPSAESAPDLLNVDLYKRTSI
jgi:hypothetical protein